MGLTSWLKSSLVLHSTEHGRLGGIGPSYQPRPNVSTVGSSITANGFYSSGLTIGMCDDSWVMWLQAMRGGRIVIGTNYAASGNNSTLVLAQVQSAIAAGGIDAIVGDTGAINDVLTAMSFSATCANIDAMFQACRNAGILFFCLNCTPLETGHAYFSANNSKNSCRINDYMAYRARSYRNVAVIDGWAATVNKTDTSGNAASGMLDPTDHVHLTIKSARAIATAAATPVNACLSPQIWLPGSAIDVYDATYNPANMNTSPLMLGSGGNNTTSGSFTGTVPDPAVLSKSGTMTGTSATSARSDGFGNDWVVTMSTTSNGGYVTMTSANPGASVPLGTTVSGAFQLSMTTAASLQSLQAWTLITITGGSAPGTYTQYWGYQSVARTGTYNDWGDFSDYTIIMPSVTLPATGTVSAAYQTVRATYNNTGGTGVFKISRSGLRAR